MADNPNNRFEPRMLIDGKLVDGEAGTFTNINPATEEILGDVSNASKADMHRAIDAARRAFDETDWSTNRAFRKRCLEQLQQAIEAEREELREELIREAGCPRMVTFGPQLDAPLAVVRGSSGRTAGREGGRSDVRYLGITSNRWLMRAIRRSAFGDPRSFSSRACTCRRF